MKRHQYIYVCMVVLLTLFFSRGVFAKTNPLWTVSLQKEVKWMKLASSTGDLIVSSDEGLMAISKTDGSIKWKMEEFKGLGEERFDFIPFTTYATVLPNKGFLGQTMLLIVIDLESGKEVWRVNEDDFSTATGHFILAPNNSLFLCYIDNKGRTSYHALCLDLDNGNVIWKNKEFFKGQKVQVFNLTKSKYTIRGNQSPLFDTDNTFITFFGKKAIRKWDISTGQMIWETEVKAKETPAPRFGYAPWIFNETKEIIYTPKDKTVLAVRTSDGALLWKDPPKLKGMVYQMDITPRGLLVKGGPNQKGKGGKPFMQLVDLTTGKLRWKKEFSKLKEASTNYVLKDGEAVVYSDKKLFAVNLSDGSYREIAKKLKFKGGDIPKRLELRDGGYFLQSSNNVMLVGFDGKVKYHDYYKAPGAGLLAKVASTVVIATLSAAASMHSVAQAYQDAQKYGYGRYKIYTFPNPVLAIRYRASKNAKNFVTILTNVKVDGDKGPGLVKINKDTGEIENAVILGTKKPVYVLDEIENRVFFRAKKNEIVGYSF